MSDAQLTIDDVERIGAKLMALRDQRASLDAEITETEHEYYTASVRANVAGPRHNGQIKDSNCLGSLEHVGSTFHSDCDWEIYRCCRCGKKIYTPSLGHNWAYENEDA